MGGIWIDGRGIRVDLAGINKVLSEEGEMFQLAGELFALRMCRWLCGMRWDQGFASFQVLKAGRSGPSGMMGAGQGESLCSLHSVFIESPLCGAGITVFPKGTFL